MGKQVWNGVVWETLIDEINHGRCGAVVNLFALALLDGPGFDFCFHQSFCSKEHDDPSCSCSIQ